MGVVSIIRDRLTNVMSGMGTAVDRRGDLFYNFIPIDGAQAEAGYRSSWLIRKIVDVPPLDMTRSWRDWQAEASIIEKLEAEEKRLQLKDKCQRALILARLFGGSALILGTNDPDPMQELKPGTSKGSLTYVHVLSRWKLSHGAQRLDPADPWAGQPVYFSFTTGNGQMVKLHPSRVIPFVGQKAPEGGFYSSLSWFWGDPIMQSIGDAVRNADLAQSGFSGLIDRASVDVLKLKDLMSIVGTSEGEEKIKARLAAANMGKSNYRALVIDTEDDWSQLQVNWAGIPAVMDSFLLIVAGAADIPMTRLLGQSPRGLQSTGDGEERDYQSMIQARQDELLKPALDRIDELLIPSAIGSRPTDIYYVFGPLQEENEKDWAAIEAQLATTIKTYADTGLLPDPALSVIAKNRLIESGRWPGSEKAFEDAEAAIAADPSLDPNAPVDPNAEASVPAIETAPPPAGTTNVKAHIRKLRSAVAALTKAGTITADQAASLLTDAAPRTLYVSRNLLNADAVIAWAKEQGFATTVPADQMHVTVLYSRTPVDWMAMGQPWDQDGNGQLRVPPGGPRMLDEFGSLKDAVVLLFNSSSLCWRHEDMISKGATSDYADYAPHITITYDVPAGLDLSQVEPYQGELVFGPEIFTEVEEDWAQSIEEE